MSHIERVRIDEDWPVREIAQVVEQLLHLVGEDPKRDGLRETPRRVARMFAELTEGYRTNPTRLINNAVFASEYQGLVLVRNIEFYSLCEHHLLPFFGRAHVAYIPNGKIVGLSKIPRMVEMYARRLQVQENLTRQIAECLEQVLQPQGVAVIIEAAHMCAMMRGVRKDEARMVTQVWRGIFEKDPQWRDQVLRQITQGQTL